MKIPMVSISYAGLKGALILCLSVFTVGSAVAQSAGSRAEVIRYLTKTVKIYDDSLKLVGELPADQLPPHKSLVGEAKMGKVPVFFPDGKGYWISKSSVMVTSGTPIVLPPCSKVEKIAKSGDRSQAGGMGLGGDKLCSNDKR